LNYTLMGMGRNTIIGFVLLGVLLFTYLFISTKNSQELQKQRQLSEDSIARVKIQQESQAKLQESSKNKPAVIDTTVGFNKAIAGIEKTLVVENNVMKIIFSNKGGQPKEVQLKNFKSFDSSLIKVIDPSANSRISYSINTTDNQSSQIADLFFN